MTTAKGGFPSKGDWVSLQYAERHLSSDGNKINTLIYEVLVNVKEVFSEVPLIIGKEMSRFCYFEGFRYQGQNVPVVNPYGYPKTNGYSLSENSWRIMPDRVTQIEWYP